MAINKIRPIPIKTTPSIKIEVTKNNPITINNAPITFLPRNLPIMSNKMTKPIIQKIIKLITLLVI